MIYMGVVRLRLRAGGEAKAGNGKADFNMTAHSTCAIRLLCLIGGCRDLCQLMTGLILVWLSGICRFVSGVYILRQRGMQCATMDR